MNPLYDYFYRFPREQSGMTGRCRVRIYKRRNGTHAVLLTELRSNKGESIASACEQIATDLAAVRSLNTKTTRWIQHDPLHDGMPQEFDEMQFTWSNDRTASDPQWQRLDDDQIETLTGDSLDAISRRLGDLGVETREENEHGGPEA